MCEHVLFHPAPTRRRSQADRSPVRQVVEDAWTLLEECSGLRHECRARYVPESVAQTVLGGPGDLDRTPVAPLPQVTGWLARQWLLDGAAEPASGAQ